MKRNALGVEMKNLRLVIGIVVILAIVCSPALAISMSDLIAQYKGQSVPTIPTVVPTTTPTTTPTPFILVPSLSVTSTPTQAMVSIDGSYRGLTPIRIYDLSVGTHQLKVSFPTYEDYSTEIVIPACHRVWYYGSEAWVCNPRKITIDVTLKKIESTQKPTIPTFVRPTSPTTIPTTVIPSSYWPSSDDDNGVIGPLELFKKLMDDERVRGGAVKPG